MQPEKHGTTLLKIVLSKDCDRVTVIEGAQRKHFRIPRKYRLDVIEAMSDAVVQCKLACGERPEYILLGPREFLAFSLELEYRDLSELPFYTPSMNYFNHIPVFPKRDSGVDVSPPQDKLHLFAIGATELDSKSKG